MKIKVHPKVDEKKATKFFDVYKKHLYKAMKAKPGDFLMSKKDSGIAHPDSASEKIASTFRQMVMESGKLGAIATTGASFAATCKELKIPHTVKGMEAYFAA